LTTGSLKYPLSELMNPGTMKLLAVVQQMVDATAIVENNHTTPIALGPQLEDPPRAATVRSVLTEAVAALVAMMAAAGAATAGAHHMVLAEELVAAAIAEAEAMRTTTPPTTHVAATMPATELKRFIANDSDSFPDFSA
jgi:hypothetical protein